MKLPPILKYLGGKHSIAPQIIAHFPDHHTYVEPFGGAGSVLFRKERSRVEVYNDKYDRIVNLFSVLRSPELSEKLRSLLKNTPYSKTEFYRCAEQSDDPVEDARRLFVSGAMCFGGYNSGRNSITGFARTADANIAKTYANKIEQLELFTARLQGVTFENDSADRIIELWDSTKTLFYVDPPYLPSTRKQAKSKQYAYEMNEMDHVVLLERLKSCAGMVVLSGYPSDLYDEFLEGWETLDINSVDAGSNKRIDRVWIKPNSHAHLPLFNKAQVMA